MTAAALLALLALGCPACRRGASTPDAEPPAAEAAPTPAGRVVDGVFVDARHGFRLPVPAPWVATPGLDAGALRVSLSDPETGARVEIWAFSQLGDQPRPRGDCTWTFVDQGRYRVLGRSTPVVTATCTPLTPDGARVYAWLLPSVQVGYQVEIHVPPAALVEGRQRGEAVVRGLEP